MVVLRALPREACASHPENSAAHGHNSPLIGRLWDCSHSPETVQVVGRRGDSPVPENLDLAERLLNGSSWEHPRSRWAASR